MSEKLDMIKMESSFGRLKDLPEIEQIIPSPYDTDELEVRLDSIAQHALTRDHQLSIRAVQQFIDYLKLPVITDVFLNHTERRKWRIEQSKSDPELVALSQQNRLNGGLIAPPYLCTQIFQLGFQE